MNVRDLPGVTLACVDTRNHALALRALDLSRQRLRFARVLLLTDAIPHGVEVPPGIDVSPIDTLRSRDDYSRFVLKSLLPHVATPHLLLIQWDGYVVNPDAFDPAFLDCDYIGAKWYWFDDAMRVGNGGFSLRSRRLLAALEDPRIELTEAEDMTIGRTFRPLLERDHGIVYASDALADRFAFEAAYPTGMPFGFHGLYNFCRVVPPAELAALAPGFSDAIARSIQLSQLLRNCIALGQWDAAAALARRRLAARPDDAEAKALLARAEAGIRERTGRRTQRPVPLRQRQALQAMPWRDRHGASRADGAHAPAIAHRRTGATKARRRRLRRRTRRPARSRSRGWSRISAAISTPRSARTARPSSARQSHPLAMHYLGVVHYQRGRHADALPLLERSAAMVPTEPEFQNNLGLALAALDRNDEAIAVYHRTLDAKPEHATAFVNLGLAYQALNRLPEAIAAYRRADGRGSRLRAGALEPRARAARRGRVRRGIRRIRVAVAPARARRERDAAVDSPMER